jgi:Fe-S cluster biogenesis protein NfuA/nitrite reductase/ring-hydroxylating ferredoxin subunit
MRRREQLEVAGERIEAALEDLGAIEDLRVRERAMGALQLVVQLYGDALERILEVVGTHAPETLEPLTRDELVASLLIVHDLHPEPVTLRIQRALDGVRPYLGSHGGDVELLGVEDGVVRLQLQGNCDGCPSSSVTLQLAVEGAIAEAAPEVVDIEVVDEPRDGASPPLIPADALLTPPPGFGRQHDRGAVTGSVNGATDGARSPAWTRLTRDTVPAQDGLAGAEVAGMRVLLARTPTGLYAYGDVCPVCEGGLTSGVLLGAVLTCPGCRTRFDLEAAGRGVDDDAHLTPLPLLEREDAVELALPGGAPR